MTSCVVPFTLNGVDYGRAVLYLSAESIGKLTHSPNITYRITVLITAVPIPAHLFV